jgi:HlyD family secretion protein
MKRRIAIAGAVAAAAVVVAFFTFRTASEGRDLVASGTVEATTADLGFQVPGRLEEVLVREGDHVSRGQLLARLDAADLEARVSAAAAQAQAARALLAELESGSRREEVSQGRSVVRTAERQVEDAERDLARARRLHDGGAISREALDRAETVHQLALEGLAQTRERLGVLETGPRPERIAAQRAAVAAAEAVARQAEVALENAGIRAPFDGRVTVRHREAGEAVQPGLPVITLMDPADRWVRIYIPEPRLGAVAIGQAASVTSDTFRGREYPGQVAYISASAEFTPRNVQTREERVKLVYAARVRILEDPEFELKPGMPADVRIQLAGGAPR